MLKSRILILLAAVGIFTIPTQAQQDSQYTQYMYNTVSVNPAYAGSRETLSAFALYRTQWVGMDGAPKTAVFSFNTPVSDRLGLGATFVSDRIGITETNDISIDVSYTIPVSYDYHLAFGLKASGNILSADYNKLNLTNQGDYIYAENLKNEFSPNFGAGVYLYSDKFYIGLSMPNFLQNEYEDSESLMYSIKERQHGYLISGYVFDINRDFKFKPTTMIKAVGGSPLQVDVSANVMYQERFVLGVAWRWDAAVSAMAGFQVNDNWFIGYGYDAETTRIRKYNSGSHEIFLRYEFFNRKHRVTTPRFF